MSSDTVEVETSGDHATAMSIVNYKGRSVPVLPVWEACACLWLTNPEWARSQAQRLVVSVPVANMYSAASEDSDVVSQAIYGSELGVLEENGPWAKMRSVDNYGGGLVMARTYSHHRRRSLPECGRHSKAGELL
jgi:hypothetical protein